MKNIVLIGMMGCGKSTVGRLLARRLGRTLIDTDQFIESRVGMTIPELFAAQGESYFRALETGVAQALSLREDLIIACGGGLPMQNGFSALRESGVVVWLNRDPADIFDSGELGDRPLAQEGREAFLKLAAEREAAYRTAAHHIITDFTSPVSTAARVLEVAE